MVWVAVVVFVAVGVGLIAARREAAHQQAIVFGASVHPGCVIVEGVLFLLLALVFYLLYREGLLSAIWDRAYGIARLR